MTRKLSIRAMSAGNRASIEPAPLPSPEALAIKRALGVPLIDRTDEDRRAKMDKDKVSRALREAAIGGNYGSRAIDNVIADIGVDRFLAAAPPDVAAKMRAQIKQERARKAKAAAPKPKHAAKIDGLSAWAIRAQGTKAQIDALNAQEAAQHNASCRCQSCEAVKGGGQSGAEALASAIRRNTAAINGNGRAVTSQAAIDRTWQEAHERVARETGRIR